MGIWLSYTSPKSTISGEVSRSVFTVLTYIGILRRFPLENLMVITVSSTPGGYLFLKMMLHKVLFEFPSIIIFNGFSKLAGFS
jgi:hypothetical protein